MNGIKNLGALVKTVPVYIGKRYFQFLVTLFLLFQSLSVISQNVGINPTGLPPNAAAGLDVDFPDKGLLIPRVSLTSTTSFAPLSAHVAGMLVYNTVALNDVVPGFYFNNGTIWIPASFPGRSVGDMLYWDGIKWQMIPIGLSGQYLQISGGNVPSWNGAALVTMSTAAAAGISGSSATTGGTITNDGGSAVLSRGVVWNTVTGPTIAHSKTSDGAGIGTFTSNLTGLLPSTTYYVRAYAINATVNSYGNEISFTTSGITPVLDVTTPVTAITGSTAVSGGNVISTGGSAITERGVCYSTSPTPTTANLKIVDPAPGPGPFISNLTGLTGNTGYYIRSYAINSMGTTFGTELYFSTLVDPPVVITTALTNIGASTVNSGGTYSQNGTGGNIWNCGVAYDIVPNSAAPVYVHNGFQLSPYTINLTGLTANTTYYLRAAMQGSWNGTNSTIYGNELTFTTPAPVAPSIASTSAAAVLSANTATSGGTITTDGGTPILSKGVCWGTTPNPTLGTGNFTSDGTGSAAWVSNITGLTGSTTYYLRAYATNSVGTGYGPSNVTFTTWVQAPYALSQDLGYGIVAYVAPSGDGFIVSYDIPAGVDWGCSGTVVGTSDAMGSGLTNTNAILAACATRPIAASVAKDYTGGGFTDWYLPSTLEWIQILNGASANLAGTSNTYYTSTEYNILGLAGTYASVAFLNSGNNYTTGAVKTGLLTSIRAIRSFGPTGAPTLSTDPVTALTDVNATSGGNISADGGSPVTARGVCWSTTTVPTVALTTKTVDGTGTGVFVSNITGLTASTTYYLRAYATNIYGTAYGNEISFTTNAPAAVVPVLTTNTVTGITTVSATSGGNITSDGGSTITARGICWSTATGPTTALLTKTSDGSGTGAFVSSMSGLLAGTTYFIRAYAINSVGTAYGNEVSFTTTAAPLLNIGDAYQGGKIAYILQVGDPGYIPGEIHGLIAALADVTASKFGCAGTLYVTGTAIGTGLSNSNAINVCALADCAAKRCRAYTGGGYTDWFLPSIDELAKVWINRAAVGGFLTSTYWSSSQQSLFAVSSIFWYSGSIGTNSPYSGALNVRPVRAF